jgi:cell division protein FtsW
MAIKRRKFLDKLNQTTSGYDWILVATVATLCIFGLAFFASSMSTQPVEVYYSEFTKQLVFGLVFGVIGAFFLSRLDYHTLLEKSGILLSVNILMLLYLAGFIIFINLRTIGMGVREINDFRLALVDSMSFLPIAPHAANGAIRWIDIFGRINFQPSELTKIVILLYFGYFVWKFEKTDDLWERLKKPLYALLLVCGLIVIQPATGTVALILAIIVAGLWSSNIDRRLVLIMVAVGLLIGSGIIFLGGGYRLGRLQAFFNPEQNSSSSQIQGVRRAIENGGLLGLGYGQSAFKQQTGILFEESTDAIIAVIAEEMGFILTSLFLSLYLILLWRGLKIAKEAPDVGGTFLATGIVVWLVSQAFLNITGITGITPLTGVPMPFVSKGGSAMLINLLAIGILINISKQRGQQTKRGY